MPLLAGEERLLTVFADIHYYFAAPTPKPLHHRFEKGSYLYIYHDPSQHRARIEIANNPGSADQDAFHGVLKNAHIRHSTQFHSRCTLTVDGITGSPQPQEHQASQSDWRLPCANTHTGQLELARLHTLDIYFWTVEDANDFLDTLGRILAVSQVETDRIVLPSQQLSSVVQQLENVAVSDPAYQNGQTLNSRSEPSVLPTPGSQDLSRTPSFAPPPTTPLVDQQANTGSQASGRERRESAASFAPLPYNPAAPAAPEPIKHREKTPPPEDGVDGTGLAAALAADHGVPYTSAHQTGSTPGIGSLSPPPSSSQGLSYAGPPATSPAAYASPPPSAGLSFNNRYSSQTLLPSPGLPSYIQSTQIGQPYMPNVQGQMSFAPPPQDPNAHLYAQQVYGTSQSTLLHPSRSGSISGYSSHSHGPPQASEYDIHSQVYRPMENEVGGHGTKCAKKAMEAPGERPRKFENGAAKLESGVNRLFRKLEKKL
ncbi:hypothetical protein N7462_010173 [Penicillium macrosclerotiorum]|uniref:uncharacterized protein n=1 Tax=Penicillium macrosclerotiorum TaxID=303699 RepID=UPI0025474AD6|nr:uncharacterized protein N7462_010173 [Penicillium macrosclerotiorum]KAJ5669103.1 hypothetical protein N7462_010173 [Penicillium macrosclerotiorum]